MILVWILAMYAFGSDPVGREEISDLGGRSLEVWSRRLHVRAGIAAVIVMTLGGLTFADTPGRLVLSASTFAFVEVAPRIRHRLATTGERPKYLAEWEAGANLVFVGLAAVLISTFGLKIQAPVISLPVTAGQMSCIVLTAAVGTFAIRGGTHIVRGVLDRVDVLPRNGQPSPELAARETQETHGKSEVDTREYNRGRVIGNLERLLLLVLVVIGSYAALGLVVAAKGLIRVSEFRDRDFAEYFLIGTFVSVLVAMALGITLRFAYAAFWM